MCDWRYNNLLFVEFDVQQSQCFGETHDGHFPRIILPVGWVEVSDVIKIILAFHKVLRMLFQTFVECLRNERIEEALANCGLFFSGYTGNN